MTFVVGFHCFDGLVLCADSLEQDGFVKRKVNKLREYIVSDEWGIGAAGAGSVSILNSFWDKLTETLGNESFDLRVFEAKTEACLKAMQLQHPNEVFYFLIGVFCRVEPYTVRLYKTDQDCLSVQQNYACIGQDSTLANFVLSTLWHSTRGLQECVRLGILVTGLMCEHGHGVERPIRAIAYSSGHPRWMHYPVGAIQGNEAAISIEELEQKIWDFWEDHNKTMGIQGMPRPTRA